jgi:hypothetical protein
LGGRWCAQDGPTCSFSSATSNVSRDTSMRKRTPTTPEPVSGSAAVGTSISPGRKRFASGAFRRSRSCGATTGGSPAVVRGGVENAGPAGATRLRPVQNLEGGLSPVVRNDGDRGTSSTVRQTSGRQRQAARPRPRRLRSPSGPATLPWQVDSHSPRRLLGRGEGAHAQDRRRSRPALQVRVRWRRRWWTRQELRSQLQRLS